jgi:hypothetical protein
MREAERRQVPVHIPKILEKWSQAVPVDFDPVFLSEPMSDFRVGEVSIEAREEGSLQLASLDAWHNERNLDDLFQECLAPIRSDALQRLPRQYPAEPAPYQGPCTQ